MESRNMGGELNAKGIAIDMNQWFYWVTSDVISDLSLGESFHCLDNLQTHPYLHFLTLVPKVLLKSVVLQQLDMGTLIDIMANTFEGKVSQMLDGIRDRLKKKMETAPTIATGHFLRVASGNRAERLEVVGHLKHIPPPTQNTLSEDDKIRFVETVRQAVYVSFLCSYCQRLELIARASTDEGWDVNLATCIHIWRACCIIQADYVADLLELALTDAANMKFQNVKILDGLGEALANHYQHLKEVVQRTCEWNAYAPSLSGSLEYIKYVAGRRLPTQFMEAEMDLFGAHSFDKWHAKGEDPGEPQKGAHHVEWKPA